MGSKLFFHLRLLFTCLFKVKLIGIINCFSKYGNQFHAYILAMSNENRDFKASVPFVMAWKEGDIQAHILRSHKGLHIKNYEKGD